jgi:hypothetical protein
MDCGKDVSLEVQLATKVWDLEQAKKVADEAANEAKASLVAAQKELMDHMLEIGKSSTGKIDGVGTFTLKREIYPAITVEKRPAFIYWVKTRGEGDIVQEAIPPGTLKTYLRELKDQLIADIEARGDQAVSDFLGRNLAPHFRNYATKVEEQAREKGSLLSPEERAAIAMELLGCYVHQEIKLSHIGKGK